MRGKVSKSNLDFIIGKSEADLITFKEYLDFIPTLAQKFTNLNFVIRPHPSENMETYRDLERDNINVHIIYSDSVTPWILASKAIIHYSSTTSIESDCLGIPTIAYIPNQPEYMSKYNIKITNISSLVARRRIEVVKEIQKIIENKFIFYKSNLGTSKYISFSNKKTPSQIIKDKLHDESQYTENKLKLDIDYNQLLREYIEKFLVYLNKNLTFRKFAYHRFLRNPQRLDYGKRKYVGWSYEHTKNVIETANKVNKKSKEFIKVDKFSNNIFLIKKN